MLGCWNTLSAAAPGVLLLVALYLSRAVGAPDREHAADIGTREDEKIPVSEHEFPNDNVRTRPDYRAQGHWATPSPDSGIELGFIPVKLYAQVRNNFSFLCRVTSRFLSCTHRYVMILVIYA
jgi:hypothetical protein